MFEGYSVIGFGRNGAVMQLEAPDEAAAREQAAIWVSICLVVEIYGPDDALVWTSN